MSEQKVRINLPSSHDRDTMSDKEETQEAKERRHAEHMRKAMEHREKECEEIYKRKKEKRLEENMQH